MKLREIQTIKNFENKKVIIRIDSDVDIVDGKILDDTRLISCFQTVKYILKNRGRVVVIGHLGRPKGANKKLTLLPIAYWFAREFGGNVKQENLLGFEGWKIGENIFLLENIRFFKEEEKNDREFSQKLSTLGDIFVNEAFAVSHREHASTFGISLLLPSYAGFHFAKEIEILSKVLKSPKRPLVVLVGGAKIETKLPLVEKMHSVADYVLVGGEIAEQDKVLLKVQHERSKTKSALLVADVRKNGKDITEKSAQNFAQILPLAKTIVWNGPLGEIESGNDSGTKTIAQAIKNVNAFKIIGGGDTVSYLRKEKLLGGFDFVSTGGGAMLEFLSGKKLPSIQPLLE